MFQNKQTYDVFSALELVDPFWAERVINICEGIKENPEMELEQVLQAYYEEELKQALTSLQNEKHYLLFENILRLYFNRVNWREIAVVLIQQVNQPISLKEASP